jgi:hypothetical protein
LNKVDIFSNEITAEGVCGAVDSFDPQLGLSGWCANLAEGAQLVELELLVNGVAIARTTTGSRRADICDLLEIEGDFGFCFEALLFDPFLINKTVFDAKGYAIRVVGASVILPRSEAVTDLAALLYAREAYLQIDDGEGLIEELTDLQDKAAVLLFQPLRKSAGGSDGCIESIAYGDNRIVWFVGWMARGHASNLSAIILDRCKYKAGLKLAFYQRPDLPGSVGVVGAMSTDWRPSPSTEALIAFGDHAEYHFKTLRPLRTIKIADALGLLAGGQEKESQYLARQLTALAHANDGWSIETPAARKIKLAVDAAAALDGFGVFAKGWVVSPARAIKGFALKLGDRVFNSDPKTLYFTPRPDLAPAFPGCASAIDRAGFCCVFRGEIAGAAFDDATLKIVYDDNSSTHHQLADLVVNKIMAGDDGASLLEFYPLLERESFFDDFAHAYYSLCEKAYGRVSGDIVESCGAALIFVAPTERRRLYYFFESLRHNLSSRSGQGVGLVIVASDTLRHGETRELFAEISEVFVGPSSLMFVRDVDCALWGLASVLTMLETRRFAFFGPGVLLEDMGWASLADSLSGPDELRFMEIGDPSAAWAQPEASSEAFVWSTQAYVDWRRGHPLPIRTSVEADRFGVKARRSAKSALAVRNPILPRLIRSINEIACGEAKA